jgi:transposase
MLAMKLIYSGVSHEITQKTFNITSRTLFGWIKSFNENGIDGLIEGHRTGRTRKISKEQTKAYARLIEEPELAGEVHWTAKKFHGYLRDELEHEVGYSTVVRWLHENNFRLKVPRSWPHEQDEEKRKAFFEELKVLLKDTDTDLWYLDETGIEGDPRPRRRWEKVGNRGKVPYKGKHIRMNVAGMICPRTGQFYAWEFTHMDGAAFQVFLEHANKDVKFERKRNILICDNATWHKKKTLVWGKFTPQFLPPYSPDLNPIERLWLIMKAQWFADFVSKNKNELIERLDKALLWIINRTSKNKITCSIPTVI